MRRDMDLVRRILMELGDSERPLAASVFAGGGVTEELAAYHIEIMRQAGLVTATVTRDLSGRVDATAEALTWDGQEFLDAVRSDGIWSKVKARVAKTVGGATLDTVKALAVRYGTEMLLG